MSPEEFNRLAAAGHTRIPVVREVLSDLDTPLSVYLKLADGPNTYLFESVEGGETWGRYSIIGLPARRSYVFRGNELQVREYGEVVEARTVADPLAEIDALRAAFPAGTVSGAPKIRALEVIRELEPVRRGVYSGAVGWLNWHGDADTAIAIRTAVIKDGRLHVQAGAGIVHDSDPAKEWEETMSKGRALFRAVARAAGGL